LVLFNPDMIGFYHVVYDEDYLEELIN